MECMICCEKFNKSTHLKVDCKGCKEDNYACRTCCQKYILQTNEVASCMFCKSEWDRDFTNTYLTKTFVNKQLKEHNENIFLDKQISLLPETQKAASVEKEIRKYKETVNEAESYLNKLRGKLINQTEIIKSYRLHIYRLEMGHGLEESSTTNFSIKCPNSKCNGFLDDKYKCSLCEYTFCKHCMEIKTKTHECDQDTVKTVSAIRKESKSCPGCGEMISKIDGCDAMWCVNCHIQFSWKTGAQLHGYNHNPEYFRWLRETGQQIDRNPNDNRDTICEGRLDERTFIRKLQGFRFKTTVINVIFYIIRMQRHANFRIERAATDNFYENTLKKERVKYLLGDINKEIWKKKIQEIRKKQEKEKAYNDIWRLIVNVLESYILIIVNAVNETENSVFGWSESSISKCEKLILKTLEDAENFRIYVNSTFIRTSNTFQSTSCPGINENWNEIYNYKEYLKKRTSPHTTKDD